MMKKYNLVPGLVISVFIALIVFSASVIRFDLEERFVLLIQNTLVTFVITFACWSINQFFIQAEWIQGNGTKALAALIVCTLVSILVHWPIQELSENLPLLSYKNLTLPRRILVMGFRGLLIGGLLYFVSYYINLLLENQKARIENERLKQENLQARLNQLKQQVSPHFLFNSLSTLRTIAPDDATKQFVMKLATVYRYLLKNDDNHMAVLRDELEFANSYVYILKERFEQALQIEVSVPESYENRQIPLYSLQILIENAVKHNVVSPEAPLRIRIYANEHWLYVENNYQPKRNREESTGKGLQNIQERYDLLANREISIQHHVDLFTVKLPL